MANSAVRIERRPTSRSLSRRELRRRERSPAPRHSYPRPRRPRSSSNSPRPFARVSEHQNRSRILHRPSSPARNGFRLPARIGSDVQSLPIRIHRKIPIAIVRLKVPANRTIHRLPVRRQRNHIKRTALQSRHQQDAIPPRNARLLARIIFDARSPHRRPANKIIPTARQSP